MGQRNCPVCESGHSDFIKRITMKAPGNYRLPETYDVVSCKLCGMVYADTNASMEDYDWYYSHCNFYGDDSKYDNAGRYGMVEGLLGQFCKKDSVMLNIGAGNGRFEADLKENGYQDVMGIDPSAESVKKLKEAGLKSRVGNIYSAVPKEEKHKYDCVFLFEVAEHLLEPGKGIGNVKELLKEDGVFMVSVPDYSCIKQSSDIAIPNYFNLEHINYFSETSLDNLMGRYGMCKVCQKREGEDLIHCYKNTDAPGELQKDYKTKEAVCGYFDARQGHAGRAAQIIEGLKKSQKEVVIWGTGSYMMALAASTSLMDCQIVGFIDNNKIKQGREIYGIPVYAPEFLAGSDAVALICSMLNSEDIKRQIEGMHIGNDFIIL